MTVVSVRVTSSTIGDLAPKSANTVWASITNESRGVPADSFVIEAHTVFADFGAKSPIVLDVTRTDTTVIQVDSTDTIQIEITNLLKFWQTDTTLATTLVLKAKYEAQAFPEIRFYPSAAAAYRPAVRITYVPRFPFGKP